MKNLREVIRKVAVVDQANLEVVLEVNQEVEGSRLLQVLAVQPNQFIALMEVWNIV